MFCTRQTWARYTPQSDEVPEERPHFQAHDPTGLQEMDYCLDFCLDFDISGHVL